MTGLHQRQGDVDEAAQRRRTVHARCFIGLAGQGREAGQKQDRHERDLMPYVGEHHGPERGRRIAEPAHRSDPDEADGVVDDTEFGMEQHAP